MAIPDAPWACTIAAIVLLATPSILLALLLRRSQAPGGPLAAAIVAGIFVGLIAGPGVLGRASPDIFNPIFVGGVRQAEELRNASTRQATDIAALRAIDASLAAIDELAARHQVTRALLQDALDAARDQRRSQLNLMAAVVVALHMYLIAGAMLPLRPRSLTRLAHSLEQTQAAPIFVGLLSGALAILIPVGIALFVFPTAQAVALGLVLAVPALSVTLRAPLLLASGASLILCAVVALTLAWSPEFTIIVGGLLAGLLLALMLSPRQARNLRRRALPVAAAFTLPIIAAMLAVRLDLVDLASQPATSTPFWLALITGLLWSSDGRMTCMWFACRMMGWPEARRHPWSVAARAGNAGVGVAQLALTVALLASGLVPEPIIAGALMGAALVELSRTPRAWFARMLEGEHTPPT